MNEASPQLSVELAERGYELHENAMSEFLLSGGSTKCSVLHLNWKGDEENCLRCWVATPHDADRRQWRVRFRPMD